MNKPFEASEKPIRFRFNAKKSAQAARKILMLSGGQRNYLELVKLLYLVDREALIRLENQIPAIVFSRSPTDPF